MSNKYTPDPFTRFQAVKEEYIGANGLIKQAEQEYSEVAEKVHNQQVGHLDYFERDRLYKTQAMVMRHLKRKLKKLWDEYKVEEAKYIKWRREQKAKKERELATV